MHLGLQIKFSKNDLRVFIILFMFIRNSSSKNGGKTTASKVLTHCFSADYVGEFSSIFEFSSISNPPTDKFRYMRLVNFFFKSVLPVILIQSFVLLLSVHCINCDTLFRITPKMFCNLP